MLEEQGISNDFSEKLCHARSQFDCRSVITSSAAKIIPFSSLTEICLIYFSALILSVLFSPFLIASTCLLYSLYVGIAVSVISILYQSIYLKKWCLLCLGVAGCILFCFLSLHFSGSTKTFQTGGSIQLLMSFVISGLIWPRIRKGLESEVENQKSKASLTKFKRNEKVAQAMFSTVDLQQIDVLNQMKLITYGASDATNVIHGLLSPSCPHCKNAFRVYKNILALHPNKVKLKLIWNTNPQNENNKYNIVFRRVSQLWLQDATKAMSALTNWYDSDFNVDLWMKQYDSKEELDFDWTDQYRWCERNEFNYSPVTILNGRVFPLEYDIDELVYFIDTID